MNSTSVHEKQKDDGAICSQYATFVWRITSKSKQTRRERQLKYCRATRPYNGFPEAFSNYIKSMLRFFRRTSPLPRLFQAYYAPRMTHMTLSPFTVIMIKEILILAAIYTRQKIMSCCHVFNKLATC